MNRILSLLLALTAVLIPAAAETTTEYVSFCGPFDRIRITDNVNVVYQWLPDSSGYMRFSGARRFADAFIVSNNKGKLRIQVNTEDVNDPELPTIYIYSNFLTHIDNSSDRNLEVRSIAPCPNLNIRQIGNGSISVDGVKADRLKASIATGAGRITVTGTVQEADYKMVGAGTIMADLLDAEVVNCLVVGAGTFGCWAQETLSVKGLGSTRTYYRGTPVVKKGAGLKVFSLKELEAERKARAAEEEASPAEEETAVEETVDETPASEPEEEAPEVEEEEAEETEEETPQAPETPAEEETTRE